jgi:type I site-specific restriction endonuclease
VPHEHRAHLIHHALKGSALDFYHETLQVKVTQLAEMFSALQEKFLSESVKLGIRAKLISLRLGDIQTAGNYTKVETIEAVKKTLCAMCQQDQDEYKTDAAMIDVLERGMFCLNKRGLRTLKHDEPLTVLPLIVTAQLKRV